MALEIDAGQNGTIAVQDVLTVFNLGNKGGSCTVTDAAGNVQTLTLGAAGGDNDSSMIECAPGNAKMQNTGPTTLRFDNEDDGGTEGTEGTEGGTVS